MTSLALPSSPVAARPVLVLARRWAKMRRGEALGSLAVASAVLGGFGLIADSAGSVPRTPSADEREVVTLATQAQTFTPFQVRNVAPDRAVALNAAVPIEGGPNPPAAPFQAGKVNSTAYARALECLAQAIYYEAAREPEEGQRAVAQVVLNRVRHPAFPSTVCGVVYQGSERPTGCQFSFTCDGSLARQPMRAYWERARKYAHEALQGYVLASVGNATHYHANYVVPYWAPTLNKNAVIATHIFYRWKGGWGQPAAFSQKYSRKESDPWALRTAALAAEARHAAAGLPAPQTADVVVEAKRELPPELARLVEAEVGAKGETRVSMRLPTGKAGDASSRENLARLDQALSGSSRWSLTGREDGEAQKPLGRATAEPRAVNTADAAAAPPPSGAGGAD